MEYQNKKSLKSERKQKEKEVKNKITKQISINNNKILNYFENILNSKNNNFELNYPSFNNFHNIYGLEDFYMNISQFIFKNYLYYFTNENNFNHKYIECIECKEKIYEKEIKYIEKDVINKNWNINTFIKSYLYLNYRNKYNINYWIKIINEQKCSEDAKSKIVKIFKKYVKENNEISINNDGYLIGIQKTIISNDLIMFPKIKFTILNNKILLKGLCKKHLEILFNDIFAMTFVSKKEKIIFYDTDNITTTLRGI